MREYLVVIAVAGATQQVGLPTLAGNREGLPDMKGWAGRAQRAHRNILESLVLFAILVLGTVVTLTSNNAPGVNNAYNGTLWNDSANPVMARTSALGSQVAT